MWVVACLQELTAIAAGLFIKFATFESEGEEASGEGFPGKVCKAGLSLVVLPAAAGSLEPRLFAGLSPTGLVVAADADEPSAAGFGAPNGRMGLEGYFGWTPGF